MTFELLFSGRLVPLSLMPDWAQRLADVLPFKWTFGYPDRGADRPAAGRRAPRRARDAGALDRDRVIGIRLIWPVAVRRYSAVGG